MIRLLSIILCTLFYILSGTGLAQETAAKTEEEAGPVLIEAQETGSEPITVIIEKKRHGYTIFDDRMLLDGYAEKYSKLEKHILMAMIKDETVTSYKLAAAVRVFRKKYAEEVFSKEKIIWIRILLRRLNRSASAFVQVEIMHTVCLMDRYHYFKTMVPVLIQKLDHYNKTVYELAVKALNELVISGEKRPREARYVFNTLRKILFLSKKRLAKITEPNERLKEKLALLRWSIKILGTQELKRLPKEVLNLL